MQYSGVHSAHEDRIPSTHPMYLKYDARYMGESGGYVQGGGADARRREDNNNKLVELLAFGVC